MKVLGIDPALSNFGYAIADLDLETDTFHVSRVHLCTTEKAKKKAGIRVNSDDLERARIQYETLHTTHANGSSA